MGARAVRVDLQHGGEQLRRDTVAPSGLLFVPMRMCSRPLHFAFCHATSA